MSMSDLYWKRFADYELSTMPKPVLRAMLHAGVQSGAIEHTYDIRPTIGFRVPRHELPKFGLRVVEVEGRFKNFRVYSNESLGAG